MKSSRSAGLSPSCSSSGGSRNSPAAGGAITAVADARGAERRSAASEDDAAATTEGLDSIMGVVRLALATFIEILAGESIKIVPSPLYLPVFLVSIRNCSSSELKQA